MTVRGHAVPPHALPSFSVDGIFRSVPLVIVSLSKRCHASSPVLIVFKPSNVVSISGYSQCSPTCGTGGVPPGFQAIILGAPFKYYGNITAINATMYFKNPSFRHAIYLQIWRPVNQTTAFTQTASQLFYAEPVVTQGGIEIQLPSQFVNQPSIQLPFIPNDVLGYYVIEDTTNKYSDIGFADSLSPYIMNSSEPSSINVYTTNTSFPLQLFSISSPPTFPNVHLLITIAYTTTFPSSSVRGDSTTVLGACPQSTSMTPPTDTPSPTSSSPPYYQSLLMLTTSASSSSYSSSYSPTISTNPSLPPPTSFSITVVNAIVWGMACIMLLIGVVGGVVCVMWRRRHVPGAGENEVITMTPSPLYQQISAENRENRDNFYITLGETDGSAPLANGSGPDIPP